MEQRATRGGYAACRGVVVILIIVCIHIVAPERLAAGAGGTSQAAHALDQHVMAEHMEQGAPLHGRREEGRHQRVLARGWIFILASSSPSIMSDSKA